MKFTAAIVATLASAAVAAPTTSATKRQSSDVAVTDELMFSISLPSFTSRHSAQDPSHLDWTTDGCTSSPDNPFGFPFVPACHRHDFGYNNFRPQNRFTESNKLRIDDQFLDDLNYQCDSVSAEGPCRALADVYYAAVRAFGGDDATPGRVAATADADPELVKEYDEKVEVYEKTVKEAQDAGELPELDEESK